MLGVNPSSSIKLKPYLVFKGSSKPTRQILCELLVGTGYSDKCVYTCQGKAWFIEQGVLDWIDKF
jgi:DDE superfamily endonuclease